ncbi:MAG: carboxypeptidase regulatory-like domain-containing protein, partial [Bacteroidota bacterium]
MPGASIAAIKDSSIIIGATTDVDGYFHLDGVPVGRQTFKVYYVGYTSQTLSNVIVSSGRQLILNVELEESVIQMKTFEVSGLDKRSSLNEMASGSVRTFNIEETEKYAGSRGDPARMASNFAGVQGADDSRNDVVIRGNSPTGLLWRLDGINIPNPNHFATPGTTGGPVSILNAHTLAASDFYTGAFPAEYGNCNAGVFDLKMRNGNSEKHEFTGQFGFLGTEILAEGPISKTNHSSYLITYRYSTLKLFQALNIKIGTDAVPNYQDASFKLNFPTKKVGTFSLFGIGGKSGIDLILSKDSVPTQQIYGDQNRDQYFYSSMGLIGITHLYPINATAYTHFTLSTSITNTNALDSIFYRHVNNTRFVYDSINPKIGYEFIEQRISGSFYLNKKLDIHNSFRIGVYIDRYYENLVDSNFNQLSYVWQRRENFKGFAVLYQPYLQYQYKATDDLVFNAGIHTMYFDQTKSGSVEPRLGMKWNLTKKQTLSLALGLHSQMQPTYIYYQQTLHPDSSYSMTDKKLGFTRSRHFVASYDIGVTNSTHVKIEAYYQSLYDVPIHTYPSSFSLINEGSSAKDRIFVDSLVNNGTAKNYGLELTVEKAFTNGYFYMFTGSLYDSKYVASDGIERSTDYNGRYSFNLLAGREFKFG